MQAHFKSEQHRQALIQKIRGSTTITRIAVDREKEDLPSSEEDNSVDSDEHESPDDEEHNVSDSPDESESESPPISS